MNALALAALLALSAPVVAQTANGEPNRLASVDPSGNQVDEWVWWHALSGDARYVAFEVGTQMLASDTQNYDDVYRKDLLTGALELVSVSLSGNAGDRGGERPAISDDGNVIAFRSLSSDLMTTASNSNQLYVRDMSAGVTTRISVSPGGNRGNGHSHASSLSGDGRFVAFESSATNLIASDTNGHVDVFLRDRASGTTVLVSRAEWGTQVAADAQVCDVSLDGRYVTFWSDGAFVAADTNGVRDVYLRDTVLKTTELVSLDEAGGLATQNCTGTRRNLSDDGRFVLFETWAPMASGDANTAYDVYLRDRVAGTTELVSLRTLETEAMGGGTGALSDDGRFVVFASNDWANGNGSYYGDAFVRDRELEWTERVSVRSSGASHNVGGLLGDVGIADGGRFVSFSTPATNLDPADLNAVHDVYVHDRGVAGARWSARDVVAGQLATFSLSGLTPSGSVVMAYSQSGTQALYGSPFGLLQVGLPLQAIVLAADASGDASIAATLPLGLSGFALIMQAVDLSAGTPSEPFAKIVQ